MILPAVRADQRRTAPWRAVTAVIALYAFVLHAALGGMVPPPSAGDHGSLCLGQAVDDGSTSGSPESGHHAHPACCTVPGPGVGALVSNTVAHAVAWPPRIAVRVAWRSGPSVRARGPPGTIAHPRGPPLV